MILNTKTMRKKPKVFLLKKEDIKTNNINLSVNSKGIDINGQFNIKNNIFEVKYKALDILFLHFIKKIINLQDIKALNPKETDQLKPSFLNSINLSYTKKTEILTLNISSSDDLKKYTYQDHKTLGNVELPFMTLFNLTFLKYISIGFYGLKSEKHNLLLSQFEYEYDLKTKTFQNNNGQNVIDFLGAGASLLFPTKSVYHLILLRGFLNENYLLSYSLTYPGLYIGFLTSNINKDEQLNMKILLCLCPLILRNILDKSFLNLFDKILKGLNFTISITYDISKNNLDSLNIEFVFKVNNYTVIIKLDFAKIIHESFSIQNFIAIILSISFNLYSKNIKVKK